MADQADVEVALVGQIQTILYPDGAAAMSAVAAVCRVYRGWPLSASLNADLAAGVINISVLPIDKSIKPLAMFNDGWVGVVPPALMAAMDMGNSVTFSGVVGVGELAGLLVDGVPYVYSAVAGDTLVEVANQLAILVSANMAATSAGATVTVPGAYSVSGRTAGSGNLWQEIRRQRQDFAVIFYCPSPALRDTVAALVDLNLAGIKFLTLADGSDGRLIFVNTISQDQNQIASIYRRDLNYQVEYATTISMTAAQMMFGGLGIDGVTSYS